MSKKIEKKITGFKVKKEAIDESPTGFKFEDIDKSGGLQGSTYEIKSPADKHYTNITLNNIEHNGLLYPYEMFINSKNTEHMQWVQAITGLISVIFQHEANYRYVINELLEIEDPKNGSYFLKGAKIPSNVAHIGAIINTHLDKLEEENKKRLSST